MVKIAVVNSNSFGRVFPEHWSRLKRLGLPKRFQVRPDISGAALAAKLRGCAYVIASVNPQFDANFFEGLRGGLRLLARHGIGVNNVDLAAATRCKVPVSKVPGLVEQEAVAEHTLALLLSALRRLKPADRAAAAGQWLSRPKFVGAELKGREIGIIGFGNIGSRVSEILSRGFGAKVLACDPAVSASNMARHGAKKTSLASLLKQVSALSLNCSLNPGNRGFLNAALLRRCQKGVVIVNTARGELVNEAALRGALRGGRVAAYATDVLSGEPDIRRKHPLLRAPGALVVPHIAAYTKESLRAMGEKMLADIEAVSKGRRPRELANPEVFNR
jgi:phosphoglycerate dehydrogenase-like enzyme